MARSLKSIVEDHDLDALGDMMAENVTLHSPIGSSVLTGRVPVLKQFDVALTAFVDFAYTDELSTDGVIVLIFKAKFQGSSVEGTDVFRFDDQGKIADVTVMLRPFQVLEAIAKARSKGD